MSTANVANGADASLPPKPAPTLAVSFRIPTQIGKPTLLRICKELSLSTTTATGTECTVSVLKQKISDHLATIASYIPHALYQATSELSACWYY
jgi:hypothetical protein